MRILSSLHPAFVRHVPHGARKIRLSLSPSTTPVEIEEIHAGAIEGIAAWDGEGVAYVSHAGSLWEKHWIADSPIGFAALAEWLETWSRPRDNAHRRISRILDHTPFKPIPSVGVTDLPKGGLDPTTVREDMAARAAGQAVAFLRDNVRLCGDFALFRSRGPLIRCRGAAWEVQVYPQAAWSTDPYESSVNNTMGISCRPDRAAELWDFTESRRGANGTPRAMPALPPWVGNFPFHLMGEADIALHANRLAVHTDNAAEEFGRRLSLPGFATEMRAARATVADLVVDGMMGALAQPHLSDALSRCATVLDAVWRGYSVRANVLEGWERSLRGQSVRTHSAYVKQVLIPRLAVDAPMDETDVDALAGL